MRSGFNILLIILLLILWSCSKDNLFDCFKGVGRTVKDERNISHFNGIHLRSDLNLILIQDSTNKIIVEAGENMQDGIKTRFVNNMLDISNENKCNWVRDYDKPMNVYVHFRKLDSLYYSGSGDINCSNTWKNDSIKIIVFEGGGSINLSINTYKSQFNLRYGTVDLNISGISQVNFISSSGYGPVNCSALQSVFTYIHNASTNNCFVYTTFHLEAKISSVGDIYYKGNPQTVTENTTGSGRLIKQD